MAHQDLKIPPIAADSTSDRESGGRGSWAAMLAALLSCLVFAALYYFRELDDNRLVSWRWVFANLDVSGFFITLAFGGLVGYMLSTLRLPGRRGLLVLSLLMGAVFFGTPEVIIDSSRYFTQAKHLSVYGPGYFISEWGREIVAWTDLPLMPFVYGMGFKIFGEYRVIAQLITLGMFGGTVWITCLLGSEMFGQRVGRLAGLMLLAMPYVYTQVPLMMVDISAMFLLTLSVYAFRRGLVTGGSWALLWAPLSLILAALVKYSLWVMLSVTVFIFVVALMEHGRVVIKRSAIITAVFALMAAPVLWQYHEVMATQIALLISYQRPGLDRWGESLFSTFFFHVHPFVTLAALASVYYALKQRARWYLPVLWLVVLLLVLLGVRRIRYTLVIFPMVALMAAYTLDRLRLNQRTLRSLVYTSVVASFMLAIVAYAPFLSINSLSNLQSAGRHLDSLDIDRAVVITLPQKSIVNPAISVPLLDLYTQKSIVYEQKNMPLPVSHEKVKKSAFRFTWTYRNPPYYALSESDLIKAVHVVIGPDIKAINNSESSLYERLATFSVHEGVFRFRPLIGISKNTIDK